MAASMIDVVALRLPVATIEAQTETGERSTQAVPARRQHRRAVRRPRLDLLHRAPVLAVAPAMKVPLGVLRPPALDGSRFRPSRHFHRERGAIGPASRCASGGSERRRPEGRRRRAGAPSRASAGATGRERPRRRRGSRTGLRWCRRPRARKLDQHLLTLLARCRAPARVAEASARSIDASSCSRADGTEAWRRLGDRLPAQRGSQRRGRRIGARGEIGVDQRPQRPRQQRPRSRPAPDGLRRRGNAGPAPGAARACARCRDPGFRLRAATPARRAPRAGHAPRGRRRRRRSSRRSTPAHRVRRAPPAGRGRRSPRRAGRVAPGVSPWGSSQAGPNICSTTITRERSQATTPFARSSASCASLRPSSRITSSVCWPWAGAIQRGRQGVP